GKTHHGSILSRVCNVAIPCGKFKAIFVSLGTKSSSEIRQILCFWRPAVADLVFTQLPVKAAQAGVIVHGTALYALHRLKCLRSQIQDSEIFASRIPPYVLLEVNIGGGIEAHIGGDAESITRIGGTEERQHQIRAFVNAPDRQGLAEILAMIGN